MTDNATPQLHEAPLGNTRLENLPVTFFASVMGLAGVALSLHLAETRFGWGHMASRAALALTIAVFIGVTLAYALKALRHPGAVGEEWHHPVKLAFFPAISISLLLMATALRPEAPAAALALWLPGVALQGALTLAVISGWIGRRPFQPMHISPAWFIPAVGNVVVPVAGVPMGFPEISWMFFSVGVIFWLVLLTLVMNRLTFHDPLPGRLLPTLVILIAPPAVGFLAWLQLNGDVLDAFARVLYNAALWFAAIALIQVKGVLRIPFALSFWALSFPVAALTLATMRYADLSGSIVHDRAGTALLCVLLVVVAALVFRTIKAIVRAEICLPE